MATAPDWTPEEERRLIEICKTAKTVAEVALALRRSRNSVIGKARRMAKRHQIETQWIATRDRSKVEKTKKRVRVKPKPLPQPEPAAPPQPSAEPVFGIPMRRISIMELEAGRCRWPLDDPGQLGGYSFCGNAAPVDQPYCRVHYQVAHIGPARR